MLVLRSICLVRKRKKILWKIKRVSEGGREREREQKRQVFKNLVVKELKTAIPVQPKLFGCRQARSARCSLLHMARSDLPSQEEKNCLCDCAGRNERMHHYCGCVKNLTYKVLFCATQLRLAHKAISKMYFLGKLLLCWARKKNFPKQTLLREMLGSQSLPPWGYSHGAKLTSLGTLSCSWTLPKLLCLTTANLITNTLQKNHTFT